MCIICLLICINTLNIFKEKGFPSKKEENWKYTDLKTILSNNLDKLEIPKDEKTYTYKNERLFKNFEHAEKECEDLLNNNLPLPAYENCIKASHYFNILDSRGAIGVKQRQSYILRIRSLVKNCCEIYIKQEL